MNPDEIEAFIRSVLVSDEPEPEPLVPKPQTPEEERAERKRMGQLRRTESERKRRDRIKHQIAKIDTLSSELASRFHLNIDNGNGNKRFKADGSGNQLQEQVFGNTIVVLEYLMRTKR